MHACLMLNPSSRLFQVSITISYFPPQPPGLPTLYKVVQKARVQRLVNYTCLFFVILIRRMEWVMSTERGRCGEGKCRGGNTVGAGGLGLSPCSCLPRLHTGLTPLSFHCYWFGTNPSNFLLRQDKMCLPYLFIYSTSHIPLFTFLFFFFPQCSLANEGLHGADKAHPAKD